MTDAQRYEQEDKLEAIFSELKDGFKKLENIKDVNKQNNMLKDYTNKMQEAKTLIKEFEREARMDGMSPVELAKRKKSQVQDLNNYIAMKKDFSTTIQGRVELMSGSGKKGEPKTKDDMTTQELMQLGRKEIQETDQALTRAQKIVEDTIQVGTKTAETLHEQGNQLNRIVDDLDEIHFSMKKATQVIRDITRGIATDRCIMFLLMIAVLGAIVVICMQIFKVGKKKINIPQPDFFGTTASPSPAGRRMLMLPTEMDDAVHALQARVAHIVTEAMHNKTT